MLKLKGLAVIRGPALIRGNTVTVLAQMPDAPVRVGVKKKLAKILKVVLVVWRDLIIMENIVT